MLKRITALVLAMLLVLSMSTAFAWTCPGCGAAMETKFCSECGTKKPENICPGCGTNHGDKVLNFCTECGTKMSGSIPTAAPTAVPTAAPTATPEPAAEGPVITDVFENGNGTISIMWNADGMTKYTIECIQRLSDDPWADRAANNGFYTAQGKHSIGFYTITRLIPGQSYWLGVFDEEGNGEYVAFDPEEKLGAFSEFALTVSGKPMIEKNGEQTEAAPLTVQDISNSEKIGFYLALSYDNPGEAQEHFTQIVIKASNGAQWAMAGQIAFKANTAATTGWKFLNLTDYFARMQECFGTVLMGNYSVIVYVNGDLVGEVPFRVEKDAAAQATAAPTAEPTAAPTEVPATVDDRAKIVDIADNGDGTVTVSWTGGTAPYKVQYTRKMSDDFTADRSAAREAGDYWNAATNVEGNSVVLSRLIPGVEYWIAVLDANDKGQRWSYTGSTEAFTDFPVWLELNAREKTGDTPVDIPCIPADTAGADDGMTHGLFMKMYHTNTGEARDLHMQIVTAFEDGFEYVYGTGTVNFAKGESTWRKWEFYSIDDLMAHLQEYKGAIPAGNLTIRIYLDGKLACEGTVPVGEASSLRITGCVEQTNGQVLLTWEDNGNAPYTVYYHERFTDDATADSITGRGIGRQYAEMFLMEASCEMDCLVPGKDYWITLEDDQGNETVIPFSMAPAAKSELNITLDFTYQRRNNDVPTELSGFSAAVLNQDYRERSEFAESYGLNIRMNCTNLPGSGNLHSLPCKWVVTMPNGSSVFCGAYDLILLKNENPQQEAYHEMDMIFDTAKFCFGEVLKGDYTYTLYVDGEYASEITFTVGE